MGGALTAVSPDFTRASLGVPGMNYSTLLPRSVDFDEFAQVLYGYYPDETARPLVLDIIQMLWDRGEPNGYARRMTTNPLPNTPEHHVLIEMSSAASRWRSTAKSRSRQCTRRRCRSAASARANPARGRSPGV